MVMSIFASGAPRFDPWAMLKIFSEPSDFCYDINLWEEFLCGITRVLSFGDSDVSCGIGIKSPPHSSNNRHSHASWKEYELKREKGNFEPCRSSFKMRLDALWCRKPDAEINFYGPVVECPALCLVCPWAMLSIHLEQNDYCSDSKFWEEFLWGIIFPQSIGSSVEDWLVIITI